MIFVKNYLRFVCTFTIVAIPIIILATILTFVTWLLSFVTWWLALVFGSISFVFFCGSIGFALAQDNFFEELYQYSYEKNLNKKIHTFLKFLVDR